MTILDDDSSDAPLVGAGACLWRCGIDGDDGDGDDGDGDDSLYPRGITQENYLRGVQRTDASGPVSFTSSTNEFATSPMARPVAAYREVYATSGSPAQQAGPTPWSSAARSDPRSTRRRGKTPRGVKRLPVPADLDPES